MTPPIFNTDNKIKRTLRRFRRGDERAFSLVELLIVIVILGILSGIAVFSVAGISDRGEDKAADANVQMVNAASEAYRSLAPTTLAPDDATPDGYAADLGVLQAANFLKELPGVLCPSKQSFIVPTKGKAPNQLGYEIIYDPGTGQAKKGGTDLAVNGSCTAGPSRDTPGLPGAPTITLTTGNGSVTANWSAFDGFSPITGYQVSTDGGATWTAGNPPQTFSGLTNGATFTLSVRAINAAGPGPVSTQSATPTVPLTLSYPTLTTGFGTVGTTTPVITGGFMNVGGTRAFSITPTLPSWLTIDAAGVMATTNTAPVGTTTYSVTVRDPYSPNGSGLTSPAATLTVTVNAVAPGAPTIGTVTGTGTSSQLSVSFTAPGGPTFDGGSPITRYQYSTNGGTNWSDFAGLTSPQLITKESFSPFSNLTNGTPVTVLVRAKNATVPGLGAASGPGTGTPYQTLGLAYPATLNATRNTAITTINSGVTGGYGTKAYTVTPALPTGLVLDPTTGTITGAATVLQPATVHTVRVTDSSGFLDDTITVTVTVTTPGAPTLGAITPGNQQLSVAFGAPGSDGGSAITAYQYSTDDGTTWRNASGTASPIVITTTSGTPSVALSNGSSYTVRLRAVNAAGNGPQSGNRSATPVAPITMAYASTTLNAPFGTAIATITPTFTGGSGARTVTVSPPLPAGLNLNATTGVITGTPTALQAATSHTFTVTDSTGTATDTITITVPTAPPGPAASITVTSGAGGNGNRRVTVNFGAATHTGGAPPVSYLYFAQLTSAGACPGTGANGWTAAGGVPGTNWNISATTGPGGGSMSNGTSYTICIRATNSVGSSSTISDPGNAS